MYDIVVNNGVDRTPFDFGGGRGYARLET